jgi:hypothetical protein
VRERRDVGQELRRDRLPRHEQLDGLEPGGERRLDEVLPLDREKPELVPPAPVAELADEPELLVVR